MPKAPQVVTTMSWVNNIKKTRGSNINWLLLNRRQKAPAKQPSLAGAIFFTGK